MFPYCFQNAKRLSVNLVLQRGFTAVVVVQEANRVVGYYGLARTAVIPDALPRAIRTGQTPNPVPCWANWPRTSPGPDMALVAGY